MHVVGGGGHRLKRPTALVLAFQLAEAHAAAAALRVAALWVGHGKAAADHGGHALEREGGLGGAAAALAAVGAEPRRVDALARPAAERALRALR